MIQCFGFALIFLRFRYGFQSSVGVTKHKVKPGEDEKKEEKR